MLFARTKDSNLPMRQRLHQLGLQHRLQLSQLRRQILMHRQHRVALRLLHLRVPKDLLIDWKALADPPSSADYWRQMHTG